MSGSPTTPAHRSRTMIRDHNDPCRCGHPAERHDNFGLGQCCRYRECGCWNFKDRKPFRDELVDFAVWLLESDPGAGREEKIVDRYLQGLGQ